MKHRPKGEAFFLVENIDHLCDLWVVSALLNRTRSDCVHSTVFGERPGGSLAEGSRHRTHPGEDSDQKHKMSFHKQEGSRPLVSKWAKDLNNLLQKKMIQWQVRIGKEFSE